MYINVMFKVAYCMFSWPSHVQEKAQKYCMEQQNNVKKFMTQVEKEFSSAGLKKM